MNKKQFATIVQAAIKRDKSGAGFSSYPIIGMEDSTPDEFVAYHAEADWMMCGVFTPQITPDVIAMVKRMAVEKQETPDYKEHDLACFPCILFPNNVKSNVKRAAFGEHDPNKLFIFGVSVRNGLPVFHEYEFPDDTASRLTDGGK